MAQQEMPIFTRTFDLLTWLSLVVMPSGIQCLAIANVLVY